MRYIISILTLLIAQNCLAQNIDWSRIRNAPPISGGGGQFSVNSTSYSAGTYYIAPGGGKSADTVETNVQGLMTIAGTVHDFGVKLSSAPGTGNTFTFTWRKNGADQAVTCAITGSATTCSDITHGFAFVVNDLVDMKLVVTGGSVTTGLVVIWAIPGVTGPAGPPGPTGPAGPINQIEVNDISQTLQPTLDLKAGSGATLTGINNAGASRTEVTVAVTLPVPTPPGSGTFCLQSINGSLSWGSSCGGGGGTLTLLTLTNSQLLSLTNGQLLTLTN